AGQARGGRRQGPDQDRTWHGLQAGRPERAAAWSKQRAGEAPGRGRRGAGLVVSKLSVRLVLAMVGVTLLTATLMIVPQVRDIAAERGALPPEERPVVTAEIVGKALRITSNASGPFTASLLYPSQTEDGVRWDSPPLREHRSLRADALSDIYPDGIPNTQVLPPDAVEATVPRGDLLAYLRGSLEQRILSLIGSASLALVLAACLALLLARVI